MQIEMGAASDVGRVRALNEDSYLASSELAVVADGMGGHACGDVASDLTVRRFQEIAQHPGLTPADIQRAVAEANAAILADAAADPEKRGMGTTVSGIALIEYGGQPHWLVFNVGDSRVYRLEGGRPVQLTVDHSEVAEMVSNGQITATEARVHPLRNIVTRSLGTDPAPAPDVWIFPPHSGDAFLICSDGLTDELTDEQIAAVAAAAPSSSRAAEQLVSAAIAAGGHDNITAIVVRLTDDVPSDETSVATIPRKSTWDGAA